VWIASSLVRLGCDVDRLPTRHGLPFDLASRRAISPGSIGLLQAETTVGIGGRAGLESELLAPSGIAAPRSFLTV
jgi:hypothetical protein